VIQIITTGKPNERNKTSITTAVLVPTIVLAKPGLSLHEVNSMSFINASKDSFSVKAYVGDEKTLLAFNFTTKDKATNLAGFTIFCQPPGQVPGYFLLNTLQFEDPANTSRSRARSPTRRRMLPSKNTAGPTIQAPPIKGSHQRLEITPTPLRHAILGQTVPCRRWTLP
jgi:hypothetical protein